MEPCDFSIINAPRAFPNASPWVGLRTPVGSTVRAFLHRNGYVYFVICDIGRWGGFSICNHDRVSELFGPGHVMRLDVPRSGMALLTISEPGLVYILAKRQHTVEASLEVLRWMVSSAVPAVKQAAAKAQQTRIEAAARAAVWEAQR